jgi:hypothetical protein
MAVIISDFNERFENVCHNQVYLKTVDTEAG